MNISEYASKIADTVKKIILDNYSAEHIVIDKIDVGIEETFIYYTTTGKEVVRRYKEYGE